MAASKRDESEVQWFDGFRVWLDLLFIRLLNGEVWPLQDGNARHRLLNYLGAVSGHAISRRWRKILNRVFVQTLNYPLFSSESLLTLGGTYRVGHALTPESWTALLRHLHEAPPSQFDCDDDRRSGAAYSVAEYVLRYFSNTSPPSWAYAPPQRPLIDWCSESATHVALAIEMLGVERVVRDYPTLAAPIGEHLAVQGVGLKRVIELDVPNAHKAAVLAPMLSRLGATGACIRQQIVRRLVTDCCYANEPAVLAALMLTLPPARWDEFLGDDAEAGVQLHHDSILKAALANELVAKVLLLSDRLLRWMIQTTSSEVLGRAAVDLAIGDLAGHDDRLTQDLAPYSWERQAAKWKPGQATLTVGPPPYRRRLGECLLGRLNPTVLTPFAGELLGHINQSSPESGLAAVLAKINALSKAGPKGGKRGATKRPARRRRS